MDSPVTPLVASPVLPAALPGWILPCGSEPDELVAAVDMVSAIYAARPDAEPLA